MTVAQRWLLLAFLVSAGILNYVDRQIIAVLKPLLQADLGWTDVDYGNVVSIFQFSAAAAYLFAGWFVDRAGVRWANPLAVGSWSLAAMAHALAHSLGQFAFVRAALGVTEALGTPAAIKTIAAAYDAKERSQALGLLNSASNIGAIVTPLTIPFLALAVGWRMTFVIVGGLGLLWVVLWFAFMRNTLPDERTPTPATNLITDTPKTPWLRLFKERSVWAVIGAKMLTDQVWWFLLFWAPDLFNRVFKLDMKGFAAPLALVYAMAALGSIAGGLITGRLLGRGWSLNKARKATMLAAALSALPAFMVLHVESYWHAALLLGLTLAAHQAFAVNIFGVITDAAPREHVGSVTSIGALFGNLAGMAVLQAAGYLLHAGIGYAPLFALASVSYLLALGWIQLMLPRIAENRP
jgi:MFS transporter, ACS family, hexuronate transporter